MSTEGVQAAVKHLSRVSYNVNDEHLLSEMDVFLQCRNNYIVRYISCALQPTYLAIIMEYAPGGSLHAVMERYPSLDIKTIRCFMHNIISGLFFLHEKNVVHCDIKPHNMLLGVEGVCKLSDFGSCLNVDRVVQDNDQFDVRGTAVYMAPEVAKGETCTAASDIFSLGVSLLELVTGRLPWVWTKNAPEDRDVTDMSALYRNSVRFIQYLCKDYVAVEIPDDMHASAAALARSCCEMDPCSAPGEPAALQPLPDQLSTYKQQRESQSVFIAASFAHRWPSLYTTIIVFPFFSS
ncbi:hypothetical protein STCU_00260 [Strigomonas culicis]|uniref:Protein kinase domain-containing protein n=1 Tax=Strigomonas culicis TaxID=28005 RepID=S9V1T9_9TRYP|nr:hypothetical protein STCU_00260 [Strigomonas culicis]|eukprot:EPY37037.1 hypothetical protein STCU_00260 [Strigomonas culicis]